MQAAAAQIGSLSPCGGRCAAQASSVISPTSAHFPAVHGCNSVGGSWPELSMYSCTSSSSSCSSRPFLPSSSRGGRCRGENGAGGVGGSHQLSFSDSSVLAELRLQSADNAGALSAYPCADRSHDLRSPRGRPSPLVVYSLFQFDKVVKAGASLWNGLWSQGAEDQQREEVMRAAKAWHTTTKGTLKKKYRVSNASEGKRLLGDICELLCDDDTFKDAGTHKGCMVRRETAHSQSCCCKNVRALFDENPTPHLVVEISVFPDGPISDAEYQKAAKIEKVLKTGHSI